LLNFYRSTVCIDSENLRLKGNSISEDAIFVDIYVGKCELLPKHVQPSHCSKPAVNGQTYDNLPQNLSVGLISSLNYVNLNNYTQPIQTEIKLLTSKSIKLHETSSALIDLDIYQAEFTNDFFQLVPNVEEEQFLSYGELKTTDSLFLGDDKLVKLTFQLSGNQITVQRRVETVFDMLANVGGLTDSLILIFQTILSIFTPVIFAAQQSSKMFYYI